MNDGEQAGTATGGRELICIGSTVSSIAVRQRHTADVKSIQPIGQSINQSIDLIDGLNQQINTAVPTADQFTRTHTMHCCHAVLPAAESSLYITRCCYLTTTQPLNISPALKTKLSPQQ